MKPESRNKRTALMVERVTLLEVGVLTRKGTKKEEVRAGESLIQKGSMVIGSAFTTKRKDITKETIERDFKMKTISLKKEEKLPL